MDSLQQQVYRLYFNQEKTQREIAKGLGISSATIADMFKEYGWKARPAGPKREEADSGDVYRLYFEERLSQREVAEKLGLKSMSPVHRIFKENGWITRGRWGDGATYDRRRFATENERRLAIKRRSYQRQRFLINLRERLFGTECKICGKSNQEKSLAIHHKDFKEHEQNTLWLKSHLESLNPEEWVVLCTACHRGVHWLKEVYDIDWDYIEQQIEKHTHIIQQIPEPFALSNADRQLQKSGKKTHEPREKVKEVRKRLFGEVCNLCNESGIRRLVIHRKDGRPHSSSVLWSKGNLESLNLNEWVALCQKCHRYVHWASENMSFGWEDFEPLRRIRQTSNPKQ